MRRLAAALAGLALSIAATLPAVAQSPTPAAPAEQTAVDLVRLAAARAALSAPGAAAQFDVAIRDFAIPMLRAELEAQPDFRPEWREPLLEAITAVMTENRAGFMEANAVAYARIFTVEELNDIGAFLRTPGGRAFMDRQLQVLQSTAAGGATYSESLAPQINTRFERLLRERGLPTPAEVDGLDQRT